MSTFDSTKHSLADLLRDITAGKIQLPDFQRGWVWDDDHIRDLLVSIARAFPVGAIMLLETGGPVRFQVRPVEGIDPKGLPEPESLILDGQQRLTTLTQAIANTSPVDTRTSTGKKIKRHYYFDIKAALEQPDRLDEAIIATDETRRTWQDNFRRDVELDLSTREQECLLMHFPCDQILSWSGWLQDLNRYRPGNSEALQQFLKFQSDILDQFNTYQLPIIELKKDNPKEAVCLVFEKVNTGGVSLTVFELVTATYAADGYNLRDDWYGSDIRNVASRQSRLAADPLLVNVESTQFLQAITLLQTYERRQTEIEPGKQSKQRRPVSAKRADVLELPLADYKRWADKTEEGFRQAGHFLRTQSFYVERELPYATQIVPLAAVLTRLGERWREPRILDKLARWFWCGALGELYGGAVETRIANDVDELLRWVDDDAAVPRTVAQASFQPERLYELRTRNSAAYKAVNVLVLREGAKDFFWKMTVKELDEQDIGLDEQDIGLDIHHIFPKKWCEKQGIQLKNYDHILNKTPISYKANRLIGGDAPSRYLQRLQDHKQLQLDTAAMDGILASHFILADKLRTNDFDGFIKARHERMIDLIEGAMGKSVSVSGGAIPAIDMYRPSVPSTL